MKVMHIDPDKQYAAMGSVLIEYRQLKRQEANGITIQWCKVHNKQSHDPRYCWPAIDVDGVDCQIVDAALNLPEDTE